MTSEQKSRPTLPAGEQVSSEGGPRGNVERGDDRRQTEVPPPIDRRGTDDTAEPDKAERLAKAGRDDFDPNEESPA